MCFGCTELVNNARGYAYFQWACANGMFPAECTPELGQALDYCIDDGQPSDYSDPATDGAPWYDAARPESAGFLGVWLTKVTGLHDSTFTREVADGVNDGSVLQRGRLRGRTIAFEVMLMATSPASMAFGIEWTRLILEEGGCYSNGCQSCTASPLRIRAFCPSVGDTDNGLRDFVGAGIIDGLKMVELPESGDPCCSVWRRGTFTMATESPFDFSPPVPADCGALIPSALSYAPPCDANRLWCQDDEDACCDRCGSDILCNCFPALTPQPTLLKSGCFCEPLATYITCCCIDPIYQATETTFLIEIAAGNNPADIDFTALGLRNVRVRLYDNPQQLDCITDDPSYELWCCRKPCASIAIDYVPTGSTLVIDGRSEKVTLNCNGTCRGFDQVITSERGRLFPLTTSCVPLMACIEWDQLNTNLDTGIAPGFVPSSATISLVNRFRS